MIVVLERNAKDSEKTRIRLALKEAGLMVREIVGEEETIFGAVGTFSGDPRYFAQLPGVARIIPISKKYKLVSRELHPEDTVVRVGPVAVGGDRLVIIAGPCAVESLSQAMTIARAVRASGAVLFRGGAFKPRTSPYSFQGLGEEGLKILADVREETGLGVVTEMTSPAQADMMAKYVDVVQIGARNMQNFELLRTVGRLGKPVFLKRGLAATIEEWLMSAEYILSEGNGQVVLCERGIRTFETHTRNTLDLTAVPVLKELTHLPVVVDPSHATGLRDMVSPMGRAAIAAGADGLMVEVHHAPEQALSDGPQSLTPDLFDQLMRELQVIAPVVGKQLDRAYLDKAKVNARTSEVREGEAKRVVTLGTAGAFSHQAAQQYFGPDFAIRSTTSFRDIFGQVVSGEADYGVLPLENALTGSIHENYDLLLEHEVRLVGEIRLRIVHSLVSRPGATLHGIQRVLSHPQALEQCREYLDGHPAWERRPVTSTARALERVRDDEDPTQAAIASTGAAAALGLTVLEEGVETNPRNYTRFVVIAREALPPDEPVDKSSLVFSTPDKPGALFGVLQLFSESHVNLSKLESRPIHGRPWEYMFYADLEDDLGRAELAPLVEALEERTEFLRVLGSYRRA